VKLPEGEIVDVYEEREDMSNIAQSGDCKCLLKMENVMQEAATTLNN